MHLAMSTGTAIMLFTQQAIQETGGVDFLGFSRYADAGFLCLTIRTDIWGCYER